MAKTCNRRRLARFLVDRLDLDDRLTFLLHVENCSSCWNAVYIVVKARHPHYYKPTSWRVGISEKELSRLDTLKQEFVDVA